jgi:peptidoglycan/LPS O-acetylase OafA/YrhL
MQIGEDRVTRVEVDGAPAGVAADARGNGQDGRAPAAPVAVAVADDLSPIDVPEGRSLTYRPALDGLRAVAVLAVMVQHAGVKLPWEDHEALPGGFLGVDVFFVISGFLITSLLLAEHRERGRIDLPRFWLRRARRLLPAVALTIAAAAVLMAVADLQLNADSARRDAFAAMAYVANWRFIFSHQSYFDSFGLPSPYRHLWSLSLEEQWYLLFPPVLLVVLVWLRHRTRLLLAGLVAGAAASAAWMAVLYQPGDDPSRVYYGTDTRAATLLVGAALAAGVTLLPRWFERLAGWLWLVGLVGAVGLVLAFRIFDGREPSLYHGGLLAVALVSAAIVVGVGLPDSRGPLHWALGRRPLVAIGVISYGLYLWHWPIYIWLTPDRTGFGGARLILLRVGVTFALAYASYRLLERPIRRHGWSGVRARLARAHLPNPRPALLTAGAGAAVAAIVVAGTAADSAPPLGAPPAVTVSTLPLPDAPVTTVDVPPAHPLPAVVVGRDRPLRVVIGGDSVAWSLGIGLSAVGAMPAYTRMHTIATISCTATPGLAVASMTDIEGGACPDWHADWQEAAFALQADVVVALWGPWEVYDHIDGDRVLHAGTPEMAAAYRRSLRQGMDATIAADPDVRFVLLTVPCFEEQNARLGGADSPRNDRALVAWVNDQTAAVARGYGDRAMLIDLGPLLCPDGDTVHEIDGVTLRTDGIHFSNEFTPVVWDYITDRLYPWLARPAVSSGG